MYRNLSLKVGSLVLCLAASTITQAQDFNGGNGRYKIVSRYSSKVIDVSGANVANGANIILWSDTGAANQQWDFTDLGNGYYAIQAAHSGLAMDVYNACTNPGCEIRQWDYWGGENQQWKIVSVGNGYFEIVSRSNGMPLDVWQWNNNDGADVRQWSETGGANQQWRIVSVYDTGPVTGGSCNLSDIDAQLLSAHNKARSQGRDCGGTYYPAVPALTWNCQLAAAAINHNKDMIQYNFFSHTGSDGSQPWDRAQAAGYQYSTVGENIAWGYNNVDEVMQGWLDSPGHCSNIMNGNFTEIGGEMRDTTQADHPRYWTVDFGRPR